MIIECKEMNVPLSEATIRQILNYNITIQADYIVITNGTDNHVLALNRQTTHHAIRCNQYSRVDAFLSLRPVTVLLIMARMIF
jgi:hypothetical protein